MLKEIMIEVALFEIKKAYEYFTSKMDSTEFTSEFALLIYNNVIMLGQPYEQIRQGVYDEHNDAEYADYCEQMKKIVMQYIDRDEQGNPVWDGQQPKITDMIVEYDKACKELDAKFDELNKRMMNKDKANYEFLKQKVKVKICSMDLEDIPNGIPPSIVGILTKPAVA